MTLVRTKTSGMLIDVPELDYGELWILREISHGRNKLRHNQEMPRILKRAVREISTGAYEPKRYALTDVGVVYLEHYDWGVGPNRP